MIHRKRPTRQRRGYAMIVVMVLILTTTAMAAVHTRHLNSALRIEQARQRSEARARGPVTVLAVACARLEAGSSPPSGASFRYDHYEGTDLTLYRVTYQPASGGRWTVNVRPDPGVATLPLLPEFF